MYNLPACVTLRAPARLHFGLLDLSAKHQRIDGGVGLAIREPRLEVCVSESRETILEAPEPLLVLCRSIISKTRLPGRRPFHLQIKTESALHVGLGMATQLSFAIATAVSTFDGVEPLPLEALALLLRRGGTSGIGIYAFSHGGLVVDGGHRWTVDKTSLGPTVACNGVKAPPLLARLSFPEWGICIGIPRRGKVICGDTEIDLFRRGTPVPESEANQICQIILMGLLPAVATSAFEDFCIALEQNRQLGLKRFEIEFSECREEIRALERAGLRGVSMSSWGPAVFGFAPSVKIAEGSAEQLNRSGLFKTVVVTSADNEGHKLTIERHC